MKYIADQSSCLLVWIRYHPRQIRLKSTWRHKRRTKNNEGSIEKANRTTRKRSSKDLTRKLRPTPKNEKFRYKSTRWRFQRTSPTRKTRRKSKAIHRIHHSKSWNEATRRKHHSNRSIKASVKSELSSKRVFKPYQEIQRMNSVAKRKNQGERVSKVRLQDKIWHLNQDSDNVDWL